MARSGPSQRERGRFWFSVFGDGIRFTQRVLGERPEAADLTAQFARGRTPNGVLIRRTFLDSIRAPEPVRNVVGTWSALAPGLFERIAVRNASIRVRSLTTWQEHTVVLPDERLGRVLETARFGVALLLPTPDGWVLGGQIQPVLPQFSRANVLSVAKNLAKRQARLCQLAHPAWMDARLQQEHASFVEHFGSDHVEGDSLELQQRARSWAASLPSEPIDGFVAWGGLSVEPASNAVLLHDEGHGVEITDRLAALRSAGPQERLRVVMSPDVSVPVVDLFRRLHPTLLQEALASEGHRCESDPEWDSLVRVLKPTRWRAKPPFFPMPVEVAQAPSILPADGLGVAALIGSSA